MMHPITISCITFVALQHLVFCWLEMFAWTTWGPRIFRGFMTKEMFHSTRALAANQGLYNAFLAAGLMWSLWVDHPEWSMKIAIFFMSCVIVAGTYAAFSISRTVFLVQGLPASIALMCLFLFG
jgi:putative membrane protein